MDVVDRPSKVETFDFRVEAGLKAAFTAAAAEQHRPAGPILRDFMQGYVEQHYLLAVAAANGMLARFLDLG